MLKRMCGKEENSTGVAVQTGTAALDPSMVNSQKIRQQTTLKLSSIPFGLIYKRCSIIPHVLNYVHNRITLSYTESENNPKCTSSTHMINESHHSQ